LPDETSTESVWYQDGLRFACEQCGDCCRGPGYVWLSEARIKALADCLQVSPNEFTSKFVRRVGARLSLTEKPNYDCVFWEDGEGCVVYDARPRQCRTFPFWPENIESASAWRDIGRRCPGVGKGHLYSVEQIRRVQDGKAEASVAALEDT